MSTSSSNLIVPELMLPPQQPQIIKEGWLEKRGNKLIDEIFKFSNSATVP